VAAPWFTAFHRLIARNYHPALGTETVAGFIVWEDDLVSCVDNG
jgi:hypothetical protein